MRIPFNRILIKHIPFRRHRSRSVAEELMAVRASRREIVQAFEIERRRIERDLHDGAQQYIVASNMAVGEALMILEMTIPASLDMGAGTGTGEHVASKEAERQEAGKQKTFAKPDEREAHTENVQLTLTHLRDLHAALLRAQSAGEQGLAAIRATVNNIHPKVLSDIGLEAAVRGIAQSMCGATQRDSVLARSHDEPAQGSDEPAHGGGVRVIVPHPLPDMPEGVAATAYFFVAEALTNAAKYAPGADVSVLLAADANLHVSVVDSGHGGARVRPGHGLAGLSERLAAFGGHLRVDSPIGGPTTVTASIHLLLQHGESGIASSGNTAQQ